MRLPTLGELAIQVSVLQDEVKDLRELVDGHEPWSHRVQLHELRDRATGEDLLAAALRELRNVRSTKLRDRVTWALACTAIIVSLLHPHLH